MAAVADPAMARMPTSICFSGPAVPASVTSTGMLRTEIRRTIRAETAKVAALATKTTDGGAGQQEQGADAPAR